jgi:hypothetical protein
MICTTCNKEYSVTCDYKQGRCPHHPPVLVIQPKDTSKGHFYVSLGKSAIRIFAGGVLMSGNFWLAGVCIVLAEVLGVIEEMV